MGYKLQPKLTIVYPVSLCSAQRDLPLFVQGFSSTPQVVPLATFKKRRGEIYGIQHLQIYIYIYIQEVCVLIFPFYSAQYVEVERDICCDRGKKTERLYFHPYKPVSQLLTRQGVLLSRIFVPSFIYFNLHKINTSIVTQ